MRFLGWVAVAALTAGSLTAEDWPEWRGPGRRGVWTETGIRHDLPKDGLPVSWRIRIGAGYSSPSVGGSRVYLTDFLDGRERVLCLDERSGKTIWQKSWLVSYRGIDYASGPRAAPTVDGDLVYVLGAAGNLAALATSDGTVKWEVDYRRDFQAEAPPWGFSSAPIVDGSRLIALPGGRPDSKVVAFDKRTGKVLWRALSSNGSEPGYSQPIIVHAGKKQQLIVWHTAAVVSLEPGTGKVNWEHAFPITMNTPIATPSFESPYLLVSGFFNGTRLLRLGPTASSAELVWRGKVDGERGDTIHALLNSPVISGDYVYGICAYGQLKCLRLSNGEQVWETQQVTVERARNASAYIVRGADRWVFYNDRGELIFGSLTPEGYQETARTTLIKPTSTGAGRRQLEAVNWAHPAFANRHVIVRNDEEAIRYSLAAP